MNNLQNKFRESDIPYNDLQKVGISKNDILSFSKQNLEALLNGKRTNILHLHCTDTKGESFDFNAKISMYRKEDSSIGVKIHPVRQSILNDIELKEKDIYKLKQGEVITKNINNEKYLVQLDQETNELLRAKQKSIIIPSYILNEKVDSKQKETLKNGGIIELKNGEKVRLDLNSINGVKFIDFELKKKIEFDRLNPGVTGTIQTDKNSQEYVQYERELNQKQKNEVKPKIKIQ